MRKPLLASLLGLGVGLLYAAGAQAPVPTLDLLNRPAPTTAHGSTRLLLDVTNGGPGLVAVGEMGLLLASADGGTHWRQLPAPSAVMLTAVHFTDARQGWAVGHDGLVLATRDGGASWQRQFDGLRANEEMLAAAREELAAAQAAKNNETRLRQAEDLLAAAEDAIKAGPSRPLLAVRFVDGQRGFAAGAFGQLFATDNGGADWRYIGGRLPNPEGLHLNGLSLGPRGAVHIAAEQGVIFSSADGGSSWRRAETGYAGQLHGVLALPDGALLAYGFNGHLFRSTDRGVSWAALPSPSAKSWVQAAVYRGQALLLNEEGRLFAGSGTLTLLQAAPLAARRFTGFTVDGPSLVAVGQGGVSIHAIPAQ